MRMTDGTFCERSARSEAKSASAEDEHAAILRCPLKNHGVLGRSEAQFAYMHGVVPYCPQRHGNLGRESVVNEEFHVPVRGSSLSRRASAAKRSASWMSSRSRSG